MIKLHSLGSCFIETDNGRITPEGKLIFGLALYLILERGRRIERDTLCQMFWPKIRRAERARPLLRQILHRLRSHGFPLTSLDEIQLPADFAATDYEEATSTIDIEYPPPNNDDPRFLPDYDPKISHIFTNWLHDKRYLAHRKLAECIIEIVSRERKEQNWQRLDSLAAYWLQIQPFNDEALRLRAETIAMTGDKRSALAFLDNYAAKLGVEAPELPLHALVERIPEYTSGSNTVHTFTNRATLVGRNTSLKQLNFFVDAVKHARGGSFMVWGDAGIGKSRLAEESSKYAVLQGLRVESVKCAEGDEHTPLGVFMNLVPLVQKLPGAAGCKEETLKSLRRITEHDKEAQQIQDSGEAEILRAQIRMAVLDLTDAVADEQPLLLIVEDVHWIDKASAKLIHDLATWGMKRRIGVLLTSRIPYEECMGLHLVPGVTTAHHLPALSKKDTLQLAEEILSAHKRYPDNDYLHRVAELSEGNPFFLNELIKHWIDTGERHVTPPSLQAMLSRRIERLSSKSLYVMQAVALLKNQSTEERLRYILEYKKFELVAAFDELGQAGMLAENANVIRSRHDLLAAAAVDKLAPVTKKLLHKSIGEILEREIDEHTSSTTLLWDCLEHWQAAGDIERARWLTMSCAGHLSELGYQKDAAEIYERGLEFCVRDEDRIKVLEALARAQAGAGMWTFCINTTTAFQHLIANSYPEKGLHNESEILGLQSTWQGTSNLQEVINRVHHCIKDPSADYSHKVKAGLLGIKVATDLGLLDTIEDIYYTLKTTHKSHDVNQELLLELELIYETMRGSLDKAAKLAEELILIPCEESQLLSRGFNCGTALFRAGKFIRAQTIFENIFSITQNYQLSNRAVLIASKLIYLHLASHNFSEAKAIYKKLSLAKATIQNEPVLYHFFLQFDETITLQEADHLNICPAPTPYSSQVNFANYSGTSKLEKLALLIHRCILEDKRPAELKVAIEELAQLYTQLRSAGGVDYNTYVLAKSLRKFRQHQRADELLCEYFYRYRLESWPVQGKLAQELKEAEIRLKKVSVLRQAEPLHFDE